MLEKFKQKRLSGIGASNGIAQGKALLIFHNSIDVPAYEIADSSREAEMHRFESALVKTRHEILHVKKEISQRVGEQEASIFDAHLLLLEDAAIIQETIASFNENSFNIDYCYMKVVEKFIGAFGEIDDPFIRERIADIKDVSHRMLGNLLGSDNRRSINITEPVILVGEDFAPSDFALVPKDKILALVTERGSKTSHNAIIARSLGVPCVVAVTNLIEQIRNFDNLLVDGYNGAVVVNPDSETTLKYEQVERMQREMRLIFDTSLPYISETKDARRINISVNINSALDMPERIMPFCDGVGLFRTENLFLDNGTFLEEEQQFEAYRSAVVKALGHPVVIRTLDLGGDKNFNLLKMQHPEENPFMGYRAIRFCLDHEDIFLKQIRAILRAGAFGPVKIMFPMISSVREIERAKDLVDRAKAQLTAENVNFSNTVQVGAMIEVPSAAMIVDLIAEYVDFISVGTNDLIQYMIAVDRVNDKIASLYEPMHPGVLRMMDKIVSDAHKANLPVSVCGEMASDPMFTSLLIGMGVTEFSMAANLVSEIKFLVRKINYEDTKKLRSEVLKYKRARDIVAALRNFYFDKMKDYLNFSK